jgi:hypothetical protein
MMMKKDRYKQWIAAGALAVLALVPASSEACTSAIFTGKVTADGRPLLWKHRDTDDAHNRIAFFRGERYDFIALLNSSDEVGAAWTGTNSAGFSIMNTASYNLKDDADTLKDREGELMYRALSTCRDLADFERMLDTYPRPMGVEANFGVIDAGGGAAYYEVNNTRWEKVDANDPKVAPEGYLVYTNFSYTGRLDEGMGYIRYRTAAEIIGRQAPRRDITPRWIFNHLSRSFYHSLMGIDLISDEHCRPEKATGWVVDQDFIPRRSTMAAVVIQGVLPDENPEMTIMWTVLGYPPAGVAVPLWVKAAGGQPALMMKKDDSNHAVLCDYALALKKEAFPLKRGNGGRYLYFNAVYNKSGSGFMQRLAPLEKTVFDLYKDAIARWRTNGLDVKELSALNVEMERLVKQGYEDILRER